MKICNVIGCDIQQHARGYCSKHYHRFMKHGDPNWIFIKKQCSIGDCEMLVYGHGLCHMHYFRWRKYGDPGESARLRIKSEQHEMVGTRIYKIWKDMRQRCRNPKNRGYQYYGGRGINVCKKWENSFIAFYQDMGNPPSFKHQIDRIDNDGNYEPSNCRWVLHIENNRNRRNVKLNIEKAQEIRILKNQGMAAKKIAQHLNINLSNIYNVLGGKIWV